MGQSRMCMSDQNSRACRSGGFKIASIVWMMVFPQVKACYSLNFSAFRLLSWVPCRGPLRPLRWRLRPLHPSQPGSQARAAQAQPGLSPHQTPSNIHNGRKNRSDAIAPRARPSTSTPARHPVSPTAAGPISDHFISIPTRDIPRPGSRPKPRHRSRPTAPATSSPL
jgi:hypothetical protein